MRSIKKLSNVIFLAILCLYVFAASAHAKERLEWIPDVLLDVAFETKYIWRGQTMVDDPVIQPGGSIELHGFTFSVWGNYDASDLDRFTEWDYIFDYTFNIGEVREKFAMDENDLEFVDRLTLSGGYIFYTFPHLDSDAFNSHEFYIGASYDVLLQPFVTYYLDFDSGAGSFLEFGLGHTFEFPAGINADLGITAGYNAGQWGYDWSFSSLLFSGEVSIPVLKYFEIAPNVNYSLALDNQYDSEFYGGVKVSISY